MALDMTSIASRVRRWFVSSLLLGLTLLTPLAQAAETVTYYYTNQQGTPLATADAAGNVLSTSDYRPYGGQVLGSPQTGPGYTGHVNDPDSGLVYMQARYYDPSTGRFLSVDPVGPNAGNRYNFNRYAYANNNPIVNIDPDGRSVSCDANSCTIEYHSVIEGAVDYTYVGGVILVRLLQNATGDSHAQQSQDHAPGSDGHAPVAPSLPKGLVGDDPRATGKNGGEAIGTSLPSDKFADTVKKLTGGATSTPDSKGRSTSPNGVSVRTGGKSGPRIDVPANGTKPPEVIHFPDDTPIPDHLKPTPPTS
ncbi:RHS repeat-associated core domain-containing protein [Luteibacter sp. OK325]|uniref:RHS repeat-associated core domain-containing protein n=1 Tax=Luteibacter sp. OK325 TaxID=2135670 RepID=UPI001304DD57|nr:RHS repeat-associated core domain-containing protein [Luteibacter sp. OK325]